MMFKLKTIAIASICMLVSCSEASHIYPRFANASSSVSIRNGTGTGSIPAGTSVLSSINDISAIASVTASIHINSTKASMTSSTHAISPKSSMKTSSYTNTTKSSMRTSSYTNTTKSSMKTSSYTNTTKSSVKTSAHTNSTKSSIKTSGYANTTRGSVTPSVRTNSTKATKTTKSTHTSSCTPATWSYFGDPLISAYLSGGEEAYTSASLSEFSKFNTDAALFQKVFAGSTFSNSAAERSYMTSLYSALKSEEEFMWGTDGVAAVNFQDMMSDGCLFTSCTNQFWSESTAFEATNTGLFYYTAHKPCCGQCSIYAQAVQVTYWPTPAPTPPVTKLVDAQNHTYLSPSVYASFTSVYAWNQCGYVGSYIYNVSDSFAPGYLRTTSIDMNLTTVRTGEMWTTINYADFGPQCTCTTNCRIDPSLGPVTELCTPQMSLPSYFTEIDSDWSDCVMGFLGVFDPPMALTQQSGLVVPKTTSAPPIPPPTTPTAQPVNTPTQPLGTPTGQPPTTRITPPATSTSTRNVIVGISSITDSAVAPAGHPSSPPIFIPTGSNLPSAGELPIVTTAPPPLTINGQTITANAQGAYVIGTQTISANAQGLYVIGTQTVAPGSGPITISQLPAIAAAPPPLTINGQTITANAQGLYVIGTQIITPGSGPITISQPPTIAAAPPPLTINGQTITANAQGLYIIGTQTITPGSGPITVLRPPIIVAGQIVTANAQGDYVIGTQTLVPGASAITIDGVKVSLGVGASEVVLGGTSTTGLGSVIISFLGGSPVVPTSTTSGIAPLQITGAAVRGGEGARGRVWAVGAGVVGVLLM